MRRTAGKYKKRKNTLNRPSAVINRQKPRSLRLWKAAIPLLCVFTGILAGIIQAKGIGRERLNNIESALIQSLGTKQNLSGIFVGNVLTNGGYMLIIWLTAFIPLGYLAAGFILFIRATSFGLTAAALFSIFGSTGFLYTANLGLQGIIMLAAAYLLCVWVWYYGDVFRNNRASQKKSNLPAYFIILLIAETTVILASML